MKQKPWLLNINEVRTHVLPKETFSAPQAVGLLSLGLAGYYVTKLAIHWYVGSYMRLNRLIRKHNELKYEGSSSKTIDIRIINVINTIQKRLEEKAVKLEEKNDRDGANMLRREIQRLESFKRDFKNRTDIESQHMDRGADSNDNEKEKDDGSFF